MQRIAIAGTLAAIGTAGTVSTCYPEGECTLEARPSVHVKVVENIDGRLVPVAAENVQYLVRQDPTEGEALVSDWLRADCVDNACQEWVAGLELEGEFEVAATVCGRTFTDVALVERTDDGCHVATQELVLEVDTKACADAGKPDVIDSGAVECTREARPSVLARVAKRSGDMIIPVKPEKIEWWHRELEGPHAPKCIDDDCTAYHVGVEQDGFFTVVVDYCENQFKAHVEVEKTDDGCHVETEVATIMVDTAGCVSSEYRPDDTGPDQPPTVAAPAGRPPADSDVPGDVDSNTCPDKIMDTPAFMLNVVRLEQDMWIPVRAEKVGFVIDGEEGPHAADCANEDCNKWSGMSERPGRYAITATVCGEEFVVHAPIEKTENGCDLDTQWLAVLVDRHGCVAAETPRPPEPKPPAAPTR